MENDEVKCPECGKSFPGNNILTRHMNVIPFIIRSNPPSPAWLLFGLQGAVGGAFPGAALGFFEKRRVVQDG